MNDYVEMIADLKELQHLYATRDLCYIDFQEKISKYEDVIDQFEQELDREFEASYAGC